MPEADKVLRLPGISTLPRQREREPVPRPPSITLFGILFGFATTISLLLAVHAGRTTDFGFRLTPEAAQTLATRIMTIRFFGVAFAVSLMLLVVFGKSRAARGALGLRWVLGLATSVAFLRGIGVIAPPGGNGTAALTLSVIQLSVEGFAILILYGEDAAPWFERRFSY